MAALDCRSGFLDSIHPNVAQGTTVHKAIILKPPLSSHEKGVLYVTFEDQWVKLLRAGKGEEIAQQYDLVLGPTWSPAHEPCLLATARIWPGDVYSVLSNLEDAATMRRLSPKLRPVRLLASSWTNPDVYVPFLRAAKTIDILMVATFSAYKRHWLFFETLRKLPRSLRVVLIGRPIGQRTEQALRQEAALFGVEDRFEVWNNATDAKIAQAICQSRISLIFSRQEGSCVAVAESLMGGTPVGVFRNARVGSKAFVNPRTGELLEERGLAPQILRFLDQHHHYDPRSWALENISCHVSTCRLNEFLRAESERSGRPWTRDIVTMYQNSVPLFANLADAQKMLDSYTSFEEQYGLELAFPQRALIRVEPEPEVPAHRTK
jgi:glycosyltransferase involved in cell wall biosynthesis